MTSDVVAQHAFDFVAIPKDHCNHCGEHYSTCKYPLSHGIPTIDSITLPDKINNIARRYKNGETLDQLTQQERNSWDNVG